MNVSERAAEQFIERWVAGEVKRPKDTFLSRALNRQKSSPEMDK
jgi:hypothetical protein